MQLNNLYIPNPQKYMGKFVRTTTHPDTIWEVLDAWITGNVVRMVLKRADETNAPAQWVTDHEYATIARPPVQNDEEVCPYLASRYHDSTCWMCGHD